MKKYIHSLMALLAIIGMKITKKDDLSAYLFLPAAGRVDGTSFKNAGSCGYYWSGKANGETAYYLLFKSDQTVDAQNYKRYRYYGMSVRPVRLVAVE